jgi:hypothetical protein
MWRITSLQKLRNAIFPPDIHELTTLCMGALSWCSSKDPIVCKFPFKLASSSFSDGPVLQDNISDSLHTRWYKFFMNHHARIEKSDDCIIFWFAHAGSFLSWRLRSVPFLTLLLGIRGIFKKTNLSSVMTQLRKSRSVSSCSSNFDTSFRCTFDCHSNFLEPPSHTLFSLSDLL